MIRRKKYYNEFKAETVAMVIECADESTQVIDVVREALFTVVKVIHHEVNACYVLRRMSAELRRLFSERVFQRAQSIT